MFWAFVFLIQQLSEQSHWGRTIVFLFPTDEEMKLRELTALVCTHRGSDGLRWKLRQFDTVTQAFNHYTIIKFPFKRIKLECSQIKGRI